MSEKHLELLQTELDRIFSLPLEPQAWGRPDLIRKAFAKVRAAFDSATVTLPERSIKATILKFLSSQELNTFLDLKYASFGICVELGSEGLCLLHDDTCFPLLLDKISTLKQEPRQFRKCYQGLLSGYFCYQLHSNSVNDAGRRNWVTLRNFLKNHLPLVEKCTPIFSWVCTLSKHENILTDKPCFRYGSNLLREDTSDFREVCEGLLIQSDSWFRAEAVRAQVEAACESNDQSFKSSLEKLLSLLVDQRDIALSDRIVIEGIARLLVRYSQCRLHEEHPGLRDAAIRKIGNPWLNRAAWDSRVENEEARRMVDGWLKRSLIRDFFSLLAADGLADTRRLQYWLRFADRIEDMWFALGPTARRQTGPEYRALRDRAQGRRLQLENGGVADNNAFIMKMGGYVLVEFGVSGNACYIFGSESLPFDLARSWVRGDTELKSRRHVGRLLHRDSPSMGINWEEKFDDWIVPHIGYRPPDEHQRIIRRQSSTQSVDVEPAHLSKNFNWSTFTQFINQNNLRMEDKRLFGGQLWVPVLGTSKVIDDQLRTWGFKYRPGKGWWKE